MSSKRNVISSTAAFAVIVFVFATGAARAQVDVDVLPYAVGGQIVTGGTDHATGAVVAERQDVFDGGLDYNGFSVTTDEPGYDNQIISNPPDSTHHLTPGGNLRFNILPSSFSGSRLGYWNGNGAVNWTSVAAGFSVTVTSQANPSNTITFDGSGATPLDGYDIAEVLDAQGKLHEHMDTFLPAAAPQGMYLLTYQLTSTSLSAAYPISIVLNYGMPAAATDDAVASVPEPASLGAVVCCAGGVGLLRRRRRNARRI